ncbi:GntR family transcriptional regulator [Paraburkholderia caballeronis]|uniref:Transcriptional regulator, GntR family n=1 Tax=Paraburkholderia caballeronis TaxID=416943 RepID=A0A1H7SW19_9BURK|nr:GntR family transcriptional regulator [Paraburkholderia caballeronis]PXW25654.1 GntR family transcriptional regulator [Paraburkholderia caballeronis]PXX01261.1 GntR family transcriptional regulator [Paraburkholderia caballeronis]RAJ99386.1 GntR family transcriptional regulator [Paraburkholderia caballeronis]TDV07105.1 GntR family transcriptional regulator [Paraburkholderia caballeronis]TDV11249.1 GntR family transcriptional regulator [Paraburkholderia caballeronis]
MTSPLDLSPAFVRLARHIRERIIGGEWLPGQLLPGEEAIAKEMKVSVGTVRKAFDVLSGQGLVTRHRGRGTFVARATNERAFTSFFRLVDRHDGMRRLPVDTILLRERATADAAERAALRLDAGELVYRLRRRRTLDDAPLVFETIAFPYARIGDKEWGSDDAPAHLVYSFLEQQCSVSISRVEDRLQACLLPADIAGDFGLPAGHPVLLTMRIGYDLQGVPVEYRRSWMATDAHDYLSELRWAATGEGQ